MVSGMIYAPDEYMGNNLMHLEHQFGGYLRYKAHIIIIVILTRPWFASLPSNNKIKVAFTNT